MKKIIEIIKLVPKISFIYTHIRVYIINIHTYIYIKGRNNTRFNNLFQ